MVDDDACVPGQATTCGPEWQDIATAPINRYVLVFLPDASPDAQILIAGLLAFEGDLDPPEWFEISADSHPNALDVAPSHWLPLPDPPTLLTGGRENG